MIMLACRVSNGIKIFHTVYTGNNGVRISPRYRGINFAKYYGGGAGMAAGKNEN